MRGAKARGLSENDQCSGIAMLIVCLVLCGWAELTSWSASAECVTIKYRDTPVCLNTFACNETPQSSFVRQICYDAAKSYMLIKLNETWYIIAWLIEHPSIISFTQAQLALTTINISEAKGLYMGLLIVGITLCRIIRDAWFAMDTDDPEQALAGFMWGVNRCVLHVRSGDRAEYQKGGSGMTAINSV